MKKYLKLNLNASKMRGTFFNINDNTDILVIKFGSFFQINLKIKIEYVNNKEWFHNVYFILKNDKTGYEYYSEEKDLITTKNDYFSNLMEFFDSAIKEKKLYRWLKNWGFKYNSETGVYE